MSQPTDDEAPDQPAELDSRGRRVHAPIQPRSGLTVSTALPQAEVQPTTWLSIWRAAALLGLVGLVLGFLAVWKPDTPTERLARVTPMPAQVDPKTPTSDPYHAAWVRGLHAYGEGKYGQAEKHLRAALALEAAHAEAYLYLGSALLLQKQVDPAIESLSMAVSLASAPEYWEESRWQLAQAFLLEGSPDPAGALLRDIIRDGRRHRSEATEQLTQVQELFPHIRKARP
ncbi:MAG: tetratricopeptide repeat protein [Candidatus Eisenbacteria bacterium]|nr:tetratricopeptide repeat protein [Candidatus Eisenbacteria bacterium]MCC7144000.1 tetratricopeptide repeat protein [Candidatus Eisenbacteria bacterium]